MAALNPLSVMPVHAQFRSVFLQEGAKYSQQCSGGTSASPEMYITGIFSLPQSS